MGCTYKLGKARGKLSLMTMSGFEVHLLEVAFVFVKKLSEKFGIRQALQCTVHVTS